MPKLRPWLSETQTSSSTRSSTSTGSRLRDTRAQASDELVDRLPASHTSDISYTDEAGNCRPGVGADRPGCWRSVASSSTT